MAGLSCSVFKDQILSGSKRQSIRKRRKRPIRVNEVLFIWWKQRSPLREFLGSAICLKITPVVIHKTKAILIYPDCGEYEVVHLDRFAIADGFNNWDELVDFFGKQTKGKFPIERELIEWGDLIKR